ncbi:putative matrix metallo proteinase [Thelonectria olida]|uniref:Matrix metallo proteinase n=1 Tax=Thelonectria olida TaxID=1576542 RepID=A0A9P9AHQ9_9HYPO|nr:putative matrix metallo proteinase [Thelonectria olida]
MAEPSKNNNGWRAPDASLASEVTFVSLPPQEQAQVREFLQRFGYLDRSRDTTDLDPSVDDHAALKCFQRFIGLPDTGKFDAETQTAMDKPRCGFPDVSGISDFVLSGSKWHKPVITWRLVGGSEDLPLERVRKAILKACVQWDRHMNHNKLQEVLSGPADILILFAKRNHGDGHNFDGPGRVLAHAYFPPPAGGMLSGDIHFDEDEKWTDDFLMKVALHEVGHSLGLAHSTDPRAVMFPTFSDKSSLNTDDIAGIRRLYP